MPHSSAAPLLDVPFPPLLGSPGFAQGLYGTRGNLELVVPDPHDGLWVFWHNNDPEGSGTDPVPGPPPGCWSGGLHFAAGRRYTSAAVIQSVHGPDHLELLAGDGNGVHRLRWSPEHAFTYEGMLPVRPAGPPALAEGRDGVPHAAVPLTDGGVARLTARTGSYPELGWEVTAVHRVPSSAVVSAAIVADGAFASTPAVVASLNDGSLLVWHGDAPGRHLGSFRAPARVAAVATGDTLRCYVMDGDDVLHVVDGYRRRLRGARPGGSGPVRGFAVTRVSFDTGRTEIAVQRGKAVRHLVQEGGVDGEWRVGEARSRVVPGGGIPEGVHRRG
ncbi:hypothetical protein ABZ615_18415 [Streptomyces sp. NPDC007325]|uniref:hypothetical protein n=1 Tax=Streptomyces sp. NPDC007325 TaxID=3154588 RepID=UPI00340755E7